jgi:hypothetical protein
VTIPGEDFVTPRQAAARDDQADADLLAVGPMISRIAATGQRIRRGLPFKVSARHVVQEQVVFDAEQSPIAFLQKYFQLFLHRALTRSTPVCLSFQSFFHTPIFFIYWRSWASFGKLGFIHAILYRQSPIRDSELSEPEWTPPLSLLIISETVEISHGLHWHGFGRRGWRIRPENRSMNPRRMLSRLLGTTPMPIR